MTKHPKLANPAGGRALPEWIGKHPDAKVPEDVQLRVWRRQKGKDAITGQKMRSTKEAHLDHDKPLSEGGEHRESNLRWILIPFHKEKSAAETTRRAKADAVAKRDVGIAPPKQKIANRGFPTVTRDKPRMEKPPALLRRDPFTHQVIEGSR